MKGYKIYALALTLALGAVSCQSDFDDSFSAVESQSQGKYITFGIDTSATRVEVDGIEVDWSTGDQMMFFNSNSGNVVNGDVLTSAAVAESDRYATFSGTVTPTSGKLIGFYPASGHHINNGDLYLSSYLRVAQPLYLSYEYDNGDLTPASAGDYCYMSVVSDEDLSSSSDLTGTINHLMAYLDLDLEIPSGKSLEKVFIALDTPLAVQGVKISGTDGSITYDDAMDCFGAAAGDNSHIIYDYFVIETSESGAAVSANSSGVVPIRIPLYPQTISGEWTIFATYSDSTESIAMVSPSVTLEAGKVYYDETAHKIALTNTTGSAVTPKIGDFYYSDGTYSTTLDSFKTVEGLVYEIHVNGVDTSISKVCSTNTFANAYMPAEYIPVDDDYASYPSAWLGVASISNDSGLDDMQSIVQVIVESDEIEFDAFDQSSTYSEIFESVFPAFNDCFSKNDSTITSMVYSDGGLNASMDNVWYLGSLKESYKYVSRMATLQSGGSYYFESQGAQLDSYTTLSGAVTRSSATSAIGGNIYTREEALHSAYGNSASTSSVQSATFNVVTNIAHPFRPIKQVNAALSGAGGVGSSDSDIFVTISGEASIEVVANSATTLSATTSGGSGSVVWSSSNESVATVDPNSGAITTVGVGLTIITASYDGSSDSVEVTVPYSEASYVEITSSAVGSLEAGEESTFTATIYDASDDTTYIDQSQLLWSITSDEGSTASTITADGVFTAGSGAGTATASVTVTASVSGSSATAATETFNITPVYVTSFSIDATLSIDKGGKYTIIPTVEPLNATDQGYTISITSGGDYISIDPDTNEITALAAGEAVISVTPNDTTNVTGSFTCTITVTAAPEEGDYLYSDYSYSASVTQDKTIIGIVYYVDSDTKTASVVYINSPYAAKHPWCTPDASLLKTYELNTFTSGFDAMEYIHTTYPDEAMNRYYPAFEAARQLNGSDYNFAGKTDSDKVWVLPSTSECTTMLNQLKALYSSVAGINTAFTTGGRDTTNTDNGYTVTTFSTTRIWATTDVNSAYSGAISFKYEFGDISVEITADTTTSCKAQALNFNSSMALQTNGQNKLGATTMIMPIMHFKY